MDLPTAADFKDLPSPPPGMVFSVFPPAREYYWDPFWWDQAGRDIISQRHIFDRYSGEEQKALLQTLLEEFPGKGGKIIDTAVEEGETGVVEKMLDLGVQIERESGMIKGRKNLPPKGQEEDYGVDGNAEDLGEDEEFYPLHSACYENQLGCVKVLVGKGGVDINAVDDLGSTPLPNAARAGHLDVVEWLLEHGADPTYVRPKEKGMGLLECAAVSGNVGVLRRIIEDARFVEARVSISLELLDFGAESGSVEMLEFILEQVGLDSKDSKLSPAQKKIFENSLGRAVQHKSLKSLDLLLSYLTPRDANGQFEYYELSEHETKVAVFHTSEDAIDDVQVFQRVWEVLLEPPTSVLENNAEAKALHHYWLHRRLISAAGSGALDTLRLILDKYKADVDHVSYKYHATPLFGAAAQGHLKTVEALVGEYHADIHLGSGTYANGPTALHNAVKNGHKEVVRALLQNGGPVEEIGNASKLFDSDEQSAKKLVVAAFAKCRAPVLVYSEEEFKRAERDADCKVWSVTLDFEGEDDNISDWITQMQVRRRDERLKEDGDGARPLVKENDEAEVEQGESAEHSSKRVKRMDWYERNGLA